MLDRERILELFDKLNSKLKNNDAKGEIGIVGGAVMCVVFKARESTKDIDGIFAPSSVIRTLANEIAYEENLNLDWLNDGAKGYLVEGFKREEILNLSNLSVWSPDAEYMLAMKSLSARVDSKDKDDIIFLLNYLNIRSINQVLDIIAKYYPKNQIPAKTTFFIEEILEKN